MQSCCLACHLRANEMLDKNTFMPVALVPWYIKCETEHNQLIVLHSSSSFVFCVDAKAVIFMAPT